VKNVLVVDDEKSFLLSLKDGLDRYRDQFQVHYAENGCQAVKTLSEKAIDLLVTDLKMPEMDGFELLAWLSQNQPQLPVVVMSAFGTPEIEARLSQRDSLQFLHKPLDIETLESAINNGLNADKKCYIHGITLATFLQLIKAERKTCTLKIKSPYQIAYLYLQRGELIDAEVNGLTGTPAALDVLGWDDTEIEMNSVCEHREQEIDLPLEHLLMEAFRIKDEAAQFNNKEEADLAEGQEPENNDSKTVSNRLKEVIAKGGKVMQDKLETLKKINGFIAAGAFSPAGELMAAVSTSQDMHLAEIGALANDILLKAQEETDIMGVGRGSFIHIVAPKANIIMRCLNENTDFHVSEAGRAHVHVMVVLEAEGNIALAKMQLEKVITEIAADVR